MDPHDEQLEQRAQELRRRIDPERLPRHVAVIMDGNGRWARRHGEERVVGHVEGVRAVRDVLTGAGELGIPYLTLYAFSTENWNRPRPEVEALMDLLVRTTLNELDDLMEKEVRLHAIGDLDSLPADCRAVLNEAIRRTAANSRVTLTLALSYSARWEITRMVREVAGEVRQGTLVPEAITEETVSAHLVTRDMPDPELLIRSSGELRVSNFLLWQIAYAELWFTDTLWPDFRKHHLFEAVLDFQQRERRFGLTGEQLQPAR